MIFKFILVIMIGKRENEIDTSKRIHLKVSIAFQALKKSNLVSKCKPG